MKLIQKYNRVNILATITVLLVGGLCYYFIIRFVLILQLDRDLKVEEQEIRDYVRLKGSLPDAASYKDQKTVFEQTAIKIDKSQIQSVDLCNAAGHENITGRQLIFTLVNNGENYKISITKSEQETEDLVQLIAIVTMAIVALLLLVLFLINRFALNKLWLPFNSTLQQLQQFNLTNSSINLTGSGIEEFNELNRAVKIMSSRVQQDYDALKTFTENASHEIQTPLAVVQSKLELLMQAENFDGQQVKDLQAIDDAVYRLSKLNQSLLLLTKIDNQQFTETEAVAVEKIITKHLDNYSELMAAKSITLKISMEENTPVLMNGIMADVLLSNLITNAIKHNLIEGGSIEISLYKNRLVVSNTGAVLHNNPAELFERFKKDAVQSESLGLGLSIVKKICDRYHFHVEYSYIDSLHTLTVQFS